MNENSTYQGWPNHATWCINLWLSNDYNLYHLTREIVSGADDPPAALCEFVAVDVLSLEEVGLATDLLNRTLADVDWDAIVQAFLED